MQFSSKALRCELSPMRKFHPYALAAAAAGKKIYHLNIGQPDVATPPALFDAVRAFHERTLAYAPSPGMPETIDAVCKYYHRIGVDITPEDVLITTGGSEALQIAFNCILDEGDEVILAEPFYPNYSTFIRTAGAAIHPIPTRAEEGFFYASREKLEAALTPRTRAILVTNPGNPTGAVLTHAQMELLLDFAKQHDLFLIADEVYREFVYSDEPLSSFAQLAGSEENLILTDSVSKRFSACGARIGCLISRNREFMAQALKYCQARLSVATLDQVAAAALYRVEPNYFDAVREEYRRRRDTVLAGLKKIPGVVCECPRGAFYLMAALPIDSADRFQQWLLEEFEDNGETVMFAPGDGFYQTEGKGHNEVRIAYVLNEADCARAVELLGLAIAKYNQTRRKD